MPKKRFMHIPLLSTRVTAVVSVTLVLVLLGIAATVGCVAHGLSRDVSGNVGFTVVLSPDATAGDIDMVAKRLQNTGGVAVTHYSSPGQILERWQQLVGPDEDILALAGVNPFTPELEVKMAPTHSCADSVARLAAPIALLPQVEEVKVHSELIDGINSTLHTLTLVLAGIAVALLAISFVLIFNTVRLTFYARRFVINTMQLVGATRGFIRSPFLAEGVVNGTVAGVLASGALAALVWCGLKLDINLVSLVGWGDLVAVMAGMTVAGVAICLLASLMACNRYMDMASDELYR